MESNDVTEPAFERVFCCREDAVPKLFRLCACGRAYAIGDGQTRCDVCEAEAQDWRYLRRYEQLRKTAGSQRRDQSARQSALDAAYAARRDAQIEADVRAMLAEDAYEPTHSAAPNILDK